MSQSDATTLLREARDAAARSDFEAAVSAYRRALNAGAEGAGAHLELARVYSRLGWHLQSELSLRAAIARQPENIAAYQALARGLFAQGRIGESRRAWLTGVKLVIRRCLPAPFRPQLGAPDAGEAEPVPADLLERVTRIDRMLDDGGLTEEELAPVVEATGRFPDWVEGHLMLARAYSTLGKVEQAAVRAEQALRLDPRSAAVLAGLSSSLHPWNDEQAERMARQALAIDPASEAAHASLGAALWGQHRFEEAEAHCREALRLNPDRLVNRLRLAMIARHNGRIEEARALYKPIDFATTRSARACADWGHFIWETGGEPEEARRWYRRAQALADDARAHFLEATLDLSIGRFGAGWDRYEARKATSEHRWHRHYAVFPNWNGSPLHDGTLLVYGEQGLGDEIMYASMLPEVRKRTRRVVLICDERLGALMSRSFPGVDVAAAPVGERGQQAAQLSGIDCCIAAGSLGAIFRRNRDDFPRHAGYLTADPALAQAWSAKLDALGPGVKIGLSWAGGVAGTGRGRRSLDLDALTPLLARPGVHWVSLQHGADGAEIARYGESRGVPMTSFDGVTRDLDDLAALVSALDLVISVCNTNVHLAGALGKEVWVMAPLVPEWRYGRKGERMLWYPSARILRQPRYGDWNAVIAQVSAALAARLDKRSAAGRPAREGVRPA